MNFVKKHKETRHTLLGSDNCVQFIGFFGQYGCLHWTSSVNLDAHISACLALSLISAPQAQGFLVGRHTAMLQLNAYISENICKTC